MRSGVSLQNYGSYGFITTLRDEMPWALVEKSDLVTVLVWIRIVYSFFGAWGDPVQKAPTTKDTSSHRNV